MNLFELLAFILVIWLVSFAAAWMATATGQPLVVTSLASASGFVMAYVMVTGLASLAVGAWRKRRKKPEPESEKEG